MRLPAAAAARAGLLLCCVLCLVGGALAAVAIAAPGSGPGHRAGVRHSHAARACHRTKHRHCPSRRKHKRRSGSKPSAPKGDSKGSGAPGTSTDPWTGAPAPVIPGSGSGSGSSPGSPPGGGAPVAETPATPATGPAHVQVTAEDTGGFRFVLSRTSVPAGEVAIEFVNHGEDEHNLNVKPGEGPLEGSLPNTAPKAHPSLTLNLKAGSYTLFCSLPGHEAKGMKATLAVE